MNEQDRLRCFKASVESNKNDGYFLEESDGSHREWNDLSADGKLAYIANAAGRYEVPFEHFAEEVKDAIGDAGEPALRLLLEREKELHGLAKLVPDDGRLESTPLIEQFKEILNWQTDQAVESSVPELDRQNER